MKNLILLTSCFPFDGGEQFLETEIKYWKNTGFKNVYILPSTCNGETRELPSEIIVLKIKNKRSRYLYVFLSFFSVFFYKEIFYIFRRRGIRNWISSGFRALKHTTLTLIEKDRILTALGIINDNDIVVYSYWNSFSFYAACVLRKKGIVRKVISRAHGGDIYEERSNNYLPLKRQFVNSFDKTYLLSESAMKYYNLRYGAELSRLGIAKLGVKMPMHKSRNKASGRKVKILSISYCIPVKQIDLIINAVFEYSKKHSNFNVEWIHIGNGPLYDELKEKSIQLVNSQGNLKINFLGYYENNDIKKYLEVNYFDVFINASQSEGIPVSIMEAMSYGIPAVAPDIGGIADLVGGEHGYLLPKDFNNKDIINGIDHIYNNGFFYRENAINWISKYFNSDINYPLFVREVKEISER